MKVTIEEAVEAEGLHAERGQRAAHDDRPPQDHVVGMGRRLGGAEGARQIAHEAAGEGVPRSRRVEDLLEGIGGRGERALVAEHQHAVLPLLDDERARAQGADGAGGLHDVPFPGELSRLRVVDEQDVDHGERLAQLVRLARDPEVHGVAGHDLGPVDLVQHLALQDGIDVAEEDVLGAPVAVGDAGLEELEDVEVGADRLPRVEVVGVLPLPVEGLARRLLQPLQVDGPPLEGRQRLLPEVVADDRHQVHGGEERRRHGEERRAPAQDLLGPAERGLDRVVRHASDDEDGHESELTGRPACTCR